MEDDAPLSLTEKLGIVSDFILSSPPGELSEVLNGESFDLATSHTEYLASILQNGDYEYHDEAKTR